MVSGAQLRNVGLSKAAISRWTQAGRLHRVHPGVYAVGHRTLRTEGRLAAALFYAGPGAALSHATALWWWALRRGTPRVIHLSAPGRGQSIDGIVVHHPHSVERVFHERLPVTPVARTLVDFAAGAAFDDLRAALAEADFRGLLDVRELESVSGRGLPGSAAIRRALRRHQPRFAHTRRELENQLVILCENHGLPMPNINVWVAGFLIDAVWPRQQLAVEVDGGPGTPESRRWRKTATATSRSGPRLPILRYTWRQVTEQPEAVAADLTRALEQTNLQSGLLAERWPSG